MQSQPPEIRRLSLSRILFDKLKSIFKTFMKVLKMR